MNTQNSTQRFADYYKEWVELYKVGSVADITLQKYQMTIRQLETLVPDLTLEGLDRKVYQNLLNIYAQTHERTTTMDFHHHLKGAILGAMDDGLIHKNPTRKVTVKGKPPREKKLKFLGQFELQLLMKQLELGEHPNFDWLILLLAKTGLRFSEGLGITPDDFDFTRQLLTINKTWDYKNVEGGFLPTKTTSSNRKIQLDWHLSMKFHQLVKEHPNDLPLFAGERVFNSTANNRLKVLCKKAGIPTISIHSLRHTHASGLIHAGVSIASVSKRLGHSSMATTQKVYLHIINEMEHHDNDKMMRHLASFT